MRKNLKSKAGEITLRDVIAHIQGVKNELVKRMESIEGEIAGLRLDITAMDRRQTRQTENFDERLNDVEINHLPKIERKLFGRLIAGRK